MSESSILSNKKLIAIISIIIVVLIVLGVILTYNSLIAKQQDVKRTWGNIEAAYQLRIDKIPAISTVVNQSMSYEWNVLQNITDLRTKWLSEVGTDVNENVNTTQQLDTYIDALMISITENYPNLLAEQAIMDFMSIIDETENVILAQRVYYNDAVQVYNSAILGFPGNLFGFPEADYYQVGQ